MKILLIEDNGSVAYPLMEYLDDEGHEVLLADNCAMAQDLWDEGGINCLIVDLNMAPMGLKPQEIEQTQGGLFTGWVWLKNYVFSKDEAMRKRTIVLTAYERDFKDRVSSKERTGVKVLSKSVRQMHENILNFVDAIAKGLKSQAKEKRK